MLHLQLCVLGQYCTRCRDVTPVVVCTGSVLHTVQRCYTCSCVYWISTAHSAEMLHLQLCVLGQYCTRCRDVTPVVVCTGSVLHTVQRCYTCSCVYWVSTAHGAEMLHLQLCVLGQYCTRCRDVTPVVVCTGSVLHTVQRCYTCSCVYWVSTAHGAEMLHLQLCVLGQYCTQCRDVTPVVVCTGSVLHTVQRCYTCSCVYWVSIAHSAEMLHLQLCVLGQYCTQCRDVTPVVVCTGSVLHTVQRCYICSCVYWVSIAHSAEMLHLQLCVLGQYCTQCRDVTPVVVCTGSVLHTVQRCYICSCVYWVSIAHSAEMLHLQLCVLGQYCTQCRDVTPVVVCTGSVLHTVQRCYICSCVYWVSIAHSAEMLHLQLCVLGQYCTRCRDVTPVVVCTGSVLHTVQRCYTCSCVYWVSTAHSAEMLHLQLCVLGQYYTQCRDVTSVVVCTGSVLHTVQRCYTCSCVYWVSTAHGAEMLHLQLCVLGQYCTQCRDVTPVVVCTGSVLHTVQRCYTCSCVYWISTAHGAEMLHLQLCVLGQYCTRCRDVTPVVVCTGSVLHTVQRCYTCSCVYWISTAHGAEMLHLQLCVLGQYCTRCRDVTPVVVCTGSVLHTVQRCYTCSCVYWVSTAHSAEMLHLQLCVLDQYCTQCRDVTPVVVCTGSVLHTVQRCYTCSCVYWVSIVHSAEMLHLQLCVLGQYCTQCRDVTPVVVCTGSVLHTVQRCYTCSCVYWVSIVHSAEMLHLQLCVLGQYCTQCRDVTPVVVCTGSVLYTVQRCYTCSCVYWVSIVHSAEMLHLQLCVLGQYCTQCRDVTPVVVCTGSVLYTVQRCYTCSCVYWVSIVHSAEMLHLQLCVLGQYCTQYRDVTPVAVVVCTGSVLHTVQRCYTCSCVYWVSITHSAEMLHLQLCVLDQYCIQCRDVTPVVVCTGSVLHTVQRCYTCSCVYWVSTAHSAEMLHLQLCVMGQYCTQCRDVTPVVVCTGSVLHTVQRCYICSCVYWVSTAHGAEMLHLQLCVMGQYCTRCRDVTPVVVCTGSVLHTVQRCYTCSCVYWVSIAHSAEMLHLQLCVLDQYCTQCRDVTPVVVCTGSVLHTVQRCYTCSCVYWVSIVHSAEMLHLQLCVLGQYCTQCRDVTPVVVCTGSVLHTVQRCYTCSCVYWVSIVHSAEMLHLQLCVLGQYCTQCRDVTPVVVCTGSVLHTVQRCYTCSCVYWVSIVHSAEMLHLQLCVLGQYCTQCRDVTPVVVCTGSVLHTVQRCYTCSCVYWVSIVHSAEMLHLQLCVLGQYCTQCRDVTPVVVCTGSVLYTVQRCYTCSCVYWVSIVHSAEMLHLQLCVLGQYCTQCRDVTPVVVCTGSVLYTVQRCYTCSCVYWVSIVHSAEMLHLQLCVLGQYCTQYRDVTPVAVVVCTGSVLHTVQRCYTCSCVYWVSITHSAEMLHLQLCVLDQYCIQCRDVTPVVVCTGSVLHTVQRCYTCSCVYWVSTAHSAEMLHLQLCVMGQYCTQCRDVTPVVVCTGSVLHTVQRCYICSCVYWVSTAHGAEMLHLQLCVMGQYCTRCRDVTPVVVCTGSVLHTVQRCYTCSCVYWVSIAHSAEMLHLQLCVLDQYCIQCRDVTPVVVCNGSVLHTVQRCYTCSCVYWVSTAHSAEMLHLLQQLCVLGQYCTQCRDVTPVVVCNGSVLHTVQRCYTCSCV